MPIKNSLNIYAVKPLKQPKYSQKKLLHYST